MIRRSWLAIGLGLGLIGCGKPADPTTPAGPSPTSLVADADPARNAVAPTDDPLGEPASRVVYLDQNWSPGDSLRFYSTSQGSQLIPYDWFLALEQPGSTTPFRDDRNMLRFRYLPQKPDARWNPDGLPVGFVADVGLDRKWLGLTCAACHTGEIHHEGVAYRVDGAPTSGDVEALLSNLIAAMKATGGDAAKFARFAAKVLGREASGPSKELLKVRLDAEIEERAAYNRRNFPHFDPANPAPNPVAYGRLDALGAIVNEIFHSANPDKSGPPAIMPADAPVSYPFLWDTPKQNLVQWIGIDNGGPLGILSLSRNVGEVLGVFAKFTVPEKHPFSGYPSTVRVRNLIDLEGWIGTLRPPAWPSAFPAIDPALAALGAKIYGGQDGYDAFAKGNCVQCHVLIPRDRADRAGNALLSSSGTDPRSSDNFLKRIGPSGKLEGAYANVVNIVDRTKVGDKVDPAAILRTAVIGTIVGVYKDPPPDDLTAITFSRRSAKSLSHAAVSGPEYKARALDGIWATAPYLHNGSVPNLDELLRPAARRSRSFSIGARTFDPVRVGYQLDRPGLPKFQVADEKGNAINGNSNAGHEFGSGLNDDERKALLEYLKTL